MNKKENGNIKCNRLGVSIVICCYNSAQRLPETLAHLKAQVVAEHIPWEVIVVDNASSDGTAEVAHTLWGELPGVHFRVVSEPKLGLSNARIKGFESAQYEYVSFIDDDNWVAENWAQTVYEKMLEYPKAGAIGGQSEAIYEVEPPEWFLKYQGLFAIGTQSKYSGDVTWGRGSLWGAGITIRKSAWEFLIENGFRFSLSGRRGKNLTTGEDLELCKALRLSGKILRYDKNLKLKHYIPSSRIQWDYLRKLMVMNGVADVSLLPYDLAISQELMNHPRQYKNYLFMKLLKAIFNIIRYLKKWLISRFKLCEGDEQVLTIEYSIGTISGMVYQWRYIEKKIKIIQNAEWNLLQ